MGYLLNNLEQTLQFAVMQRGYDFAKVADLRVFNVLNTTTDLPDFLCLPRKAMSLHCPCRLGSGCLTL